MNTTAILTILVTTILGGGFVGGIVALVKLKPEGDQIVVSAAKDVVVIQKGLLDGMEARLRAMEGRLDKQVALSAAALAECHREREVLRTQLVAERLNNVSLRERIEALETEVAQLRAAQARGSS